MKQAGMEAGHIKQLDWAISFSRRDLGSFREGDLLNAKQDLFDFIRGEDERPREEELSADVVLPPAERYRAWFDTEATTETLAQVQEFFRRELKNLAFEEGRDEHLPVKASSIKDLEIAVLGFTPGHPFKLSILQPEELVIQAVAALFNHLVSSGILRGQLRICPVCQSIFLHKRKPRTDVTLHCTVQCSRQAATHRYREKQSKDKGEEIKAVERERSHRRYVEEQHRKHGPKVKVERRPRKARGG